jgi:hypothetical protein
MKRKSKTRKSIKICIELVLNSECHKCGWRCFCILSGCEHASGTNVASQFIQNTTNIEVFFRAAVCDEWSVSVGYVLLAVHLDTSRYISPQHIPIAVFIQYTS